MERTIRDRFGRVWTLQWENYYAHSNGRIVRHIDDIRRRTAFHAYS